jgi:hypothetical protein
MALSDHGEGKSRDLKGHRVGLAHVADVADNLDAVVTGELWSKQLWANKTAEYVGWAYHSFGRLFIR